MCQPNHEIRMHLQLHLFTKLHSLFFIKKNHPVSKVEFFRRNGAFTGTIKLIFNNRKALVDTLSERAICIHTHRHLLEEFKPTPRVIKCHRCQAFGHIARRCIVATVNPSVASAGRILMKQINVTVMSLNVLTAMKTT